MTNSSASSKNKLLIIHGLNNNLECFSPLGKEFEKKNFEVYYLTLPAHGNDKTVLDLDQALQQFDRDMQKFISSDPYSVIAFSQGALYLQLWLALPGSPKPKAQVLLAPALLIRKSAFINKLVDLLPNSFWFFSVTPKRLRLRRRRFIWEYRLLIEGIRRLKFDFEAPTLIMIDPRDELVDAQSLEKEVSSKVRFEMMKRGKLSSKEIGAYHAIFHPYYHVTGDWEKFISRLDNFLRKVH